VVDALTDVHVCVLHGEQDELGDVVNIPLGQCGKCIRWLQLLHRQLGDKRTLNWASLELVQHEFADSRIEFRASLEQGGVQERDLAAGFRAKIGKYLKINRFEKKQVD